MYNMYSKKNDKYETIYHINDFGEKSNNVKISEFNFLPSIEINLMAPAKDFLDVYKANPDNDLFSEK